MKVRLYMLSTVFILSFTVNSHAQLLKKLKNKVKAATENTLFKGEDDTNLGVLLYTLDGSWTRIGGNNNKANGMVVEIGNAKGVIVDAANTRLKKGDLKWKNITAKDSVSIAHQELGSDYNYYDASMKLVTRDTLKLRVGAMRSGNIQTWIRTKTRSLGISQTNTDQSQPNGTIQTNPNNQLPENSSENPSENYGFEWKYVLKIETPKAKDNIKMEYYLKQGATYWGARMPEVPEPVNQLMIYDAGMNKMLILMEQEGMKMKMIQPLNIDLAEASEEDFIDNYSSEYLGSKILLGFNCDGYKYENKNYTFTIYATTQPGVSFNQVFSGNSKSKIPKGMSGIFGDSNMGNALVMEMEMIDKRKKRNSMHMTCIELVESSFAINTSNYRSFGRN